MTTFAKITLTGLTLVIVFAVALTVWVSRIDVKGRFEATASESLGLSVRVEGDTSTRILPTLRVTFENVRARKGAREIASVGRAEATLAYSPLLRRRAVFRRVHLDQVKIAFERSADGVLDIARGKHEPSKLNEVHIERLSFAHTDFVYLNRQFDKFFAGTGCESDDLELRFANASDRKAMENVALSARIRCAEMRNTRFVANRVDFQVKGADGHLKFAPVNMSMLEGKGSAVIDGDYTGDVPTYRVHYEVKRLQAQALFNSVAPKVTGSGLLDFAADLRMRGRNSREWTHTASGEAVLKGKNLELEIGDLDAKLARFDRTQKFDLLDLAALLVAGPFGPVVTKGAEFAAAATTKGDSTHVDTFSSSWRVENGIAHAQDVAAATKENRVAMKGGLDFFHHEYVDVTLAAVDNEGCMRVEQKVRGPFEKPKVDKTTAVKMLAGPFKHIAKKVKEAAGEECPVFYAGTVAAKART